MRPITLLGITIFLFHLLATPAFAEQLTQPEPSVVTESPQSQICDDEPQLDSFTAGLTQGLECTPMALALGAGAVTKFAPLKAAAFAKAIGKVGARLFSTVTWVGGTLAVVELTKVLSGATDYARSCQKNEFNYKKFLISQTERRGQRIAEALEKGGLPLSSRERNRLRYPAGSKVESRVKDLDCATLIRENNGIRARQNRVFKTKLEGTLRPIAFPKEEDQKMSTEDSSLVRDLSEIIGCLSPSQQLRVVCAVGSSLAFGVQLTKDLKALAARKKAIQDKATQKKAAQEEALQVAKVRTELHKSHMVGNMRFPRNSNGIVATVVTRMLRSGFDARELSRRPSPEEVSNAVKSANQAHLHKGVLNKGLPVKISPDQALRVLNLAGNKSLGSLTFIQRILASGNPGVLRKASPRPPHLSAHDFADEANLFLSSQSVAGKKYLAEIGDTLHEALWGDEMKALSRQWLKSVEEKRDVLGTQAEVEFVSKFRKIVKATLIKKHPELKAKISPEDKDEIFGDASSRMNIDSDSTKADAIAYTFGL